MMTSLNLAKTIAKLALETKALNLKILDLRKVSAVADFFVIASGSSDRHLRAICDTVSSALKEKGVRAFSSEGYQQGRWLLLDYTDVVLHVFLEEEREHYDLEGFWQSAPSVKSPGSTKPAKAASRGPRKKAAGKTVKASHETQARRGRKTQRPRTSRKK